MHTEKKNRYYGTIKISLFIRWKKTEPEGWGWGVGGGLSLVAPKLMWKKPGCN